METTLTERVEVDNNVRLLPANSDWVFGSLTTPRLILNGETATANLTFDTGADIVEYTGPGDDGTLDSIDPDAEANVEWRYLRTTIGTLLRYSRQSVRASEIEDSGITGGDATRVTLTATPSLSFVASRRDQLALNGNVIITDFEDDVPGSARTGSSTYGLSLQWSRTFSRNESGSLSIGISRFDADALGGQQSLTYSSDAGYQRQITPRLSFDGNVGVDLVDSEQGLDVARISDSSLSFSTDTSASYNLARTRFSLSLSQTIEPSARGAVEQRSTTSFSIEHDINRTMAASLTGNYSAQASSISFLPLGNTRRELINIEPSFSWEIFSDLDLNAGYRFRHSDSRDTAETATSSAIYLSITYRPPAL